MQGGISNSEKEKQWINKSLFEKDQKKLIKYRGQKKKKKKSNPVSSNYFSTSIYIYIKKK